MSLTCYNITCENTESRVGTMLAHEIVLDVFRKGRSLIKSDPITSTIIDTKSGTIIEITAYK